MDLPPKERKCHLTGFTKSCRTLVTSGKCGRWMHIQGNCPNTGQPINESRCVDDWLHTLLMENSMLQKQTGASADKVATEVKKAADAIKEFHKDTTAQNNRILEIAAPAAPSDPKLIEATPLKDED